MDKINDKKLALEVIKIVLLGDTFVGKTAIFNANLGNEFNGRKIQTIGHDKSDTTFTLKNEKKN